MADFEEPPSPETESPLKFPCEYPLKVMGVTGSEFQSEAFSIVGRHVPDLDGSRVETRKSREGRYVSYTFHFTAQRREQLEALYTELNASELVRAVL
ncbi:MAG: DUF493 domain-containing protein [Myxococcota bacterium]|jgi:uncharacterized protein|nr:DUF493 domain-containing protein [Myxococcota bacterium]